MKDFKFLAASEYPFDANTFAEMQEDYKLFQAVISSVLSNSTTTGKYIIYGCDIDGATLTAGLMLIDGELVRFSAGDYFGAGTYIHVTTVNSQVVHSGVTYAINSEKIAGSSSSAGGAGLYSDFRRVGKLRRDNEWLSATFVPFSDTTGITVAFAKSFAKPGELTVRAQFAVDISAVTNSAATVEIRNFAAIIASYGVENNNHVIGRYNLFHTTAGVEVQQHSGNVIGGTGGKMYLMMPDTLVSGVAGMQRATWDDLGGGDGSSYPTYRIELTALFTSVTY